MELPAGAEELDGDVNSDGHDGNCKLGKRTGAEAGRSC